jgi:flagellar P-ring protein precursor FlgI
LLRNPDFTTAKQIADAVNQEFHKEIASALDSTRVDVNVADAGAASVPALIARLQNLALTVFTPAKIVINERTGTIVLGGDVKLTPVSVIHGNLSIQVVTSYAVVPLGGIQGSTSSEGGRGGRGASGPSSRAPAGSGSSGSAEGGRREDRFVENPTAALVQQQNVNVTDAPAQTMRLDEGANVEELVSGLHAIGTTAHDVVAILEAIKAEGGIQAELEVQ